MGQVQQRDRWERQCKPSIQPPERANTTPLSVSGGRFRLRLPVPCVQRYGSGDDGREQECRQVPDGCPQKSPFDQEPTVETNERHPDGCRHDDEPDPWPVGGFRATIIRIEGTRSRHGR